MADATLLRQDQATISVTDLGIPGGLPHVKSWSKLEGGDIESEDTKTRPGGMVGQINLGGPSTRTDATVSRPYNAELHTHIKQLEDRAGNQLFHIHWTPLDASGSSAGNSTHTLQGILKNVMRPNWDANTTGVAELSLVMGCNVEAAMTH